MFKPHSIKKMVSTLLITSLFMVQGLSVPIIKNNTNSSFAASVKCLNVAVGKSVSASGFILGEPKTAVDKDLNSDKFAGVSDNLQWLQVDLGKAYPLLGISLWHYYKDNRTYKDVIVMLSNSPDFSSGNTTVFNNDTDNSAGLGKGSQAEYAETEKGKLIAFKATKARYIRFYSNGSSANIYNHYVEIKAWSPASFIQTPTTIPQDNKVTPTLAPTKAPTNTPSKPSVTIQPTKPASTQVPETPKDVVTVEQAMFDDFSYSGNNDSNLSSMKWILRNGSGGPGPGSCSWSKNNISFFDDPSGNGNKIMRMQATTNGTGAGTSQAEIYTPQKYLEGTYATRIRFTDKPISGADGDQINETFFTITPLKFDMDPSYSELDFEYLANGGWGKNGTTMWNTTWETYKPEPWTADNSTSSISKSFDGWHTLVMVVINGEVKFYYDGELKATHGGKYYPESLMTINFNIWFIAEGLIGGGGSRTYVQDVDWVYHAKNKVLTPNQVTSNVENYRKTNVKRLDTVK